MGDGAEAGDCWCCWYDSVGFCTLVKVVYYSLRYHCVLPCAAPRVFSGAVESGGCVKAIRVPDGARISNSRLKAKGDVSEQAVAGGLAGLAYIRVLPGGEARAHRGTYAQGHTSESCREVRHRHRCAQGHAGTGTQAQAQRGANTHTGAHTPGTGTGTHIVKPHGHTLTAAVHMHIAHERCAGPEEHAHC